MAEGKKSEAEAASVEETARRRRASDAGSVAPTPVVQSTTEVTPAEADKSSLPNALDAKAEDPPVRASLPDTPIAQTLAAGAGEHTPPDPQVFGQGGAAVRGDGRGAAEVGRGGARASRRRPRPRTPIGGTDASHRESGGSG